jgi:hypothetical protein
MTYQTHLHMPTPVQDLRGQQNWFKNGFKMNLWNDKRSEAGTLGPSPPAKLGKSLIHSHTDSATPCSSSHKSATLEPLTADMVAVQTIDFRNKVASLSYLTLLFVGLRVLRICWVLSFTVLIRFFSDQSDD